MQDAASEEEVNDLFEELSRNTDSKEWEALIAEITMTAENNSGYNKERWEPLISKIIEHGNAPVRYINGHGRWWWAAACIILLLGTGSYFLFSNKPKNHIEVAKTAVPTDVKAPASNNAVITLANEKQIVLDSAGNGTLALQGNVNVVKLADGQIAYSGKSSDVMYNTLTNPRGSRVVNLMLSDGSKVWLNAESTLKYPTAFIGTERKVEITGEAYFEVAKNPDMPFYVTREIVNIKVLGTHFNVNAFEDDDSNIKVTLLEGAVKINNRNSKAFLKPGQQALVSNELKVVDDVDLDKVMAWKNGYFQFDKASLQSVLKQVSRWYDVEVIYQGKNRPKEFIGKIQRDLSLSEILKFLEIYNINFTIEEKKLIIKPD